MWSSSPSAAEMESLPGFSSDWIAIQGLLGGSWVGINKGKL